MVRRSSTVSFERIQHIQKDIQIIQGDLHDQSSLAFILDQYRPDEIYNLGAQSFVASSWNQAVLTGDVTALGVTRLLEATHQVVPDCRFYQASSSEVFGKAIETPQKETTPFYPRSPYGVAKMYGHWITLNYREYYNMFAVSGILFNHESPRRGLEFVTRKISNSAANIKMGLAKELRLGNLEARRDWGFTGEYVQAMWKMLQQEKAEDFVIGTGQTHSVREFCELAFNYVGLNYQDYVIQDPLFLRPLEETQLIADPSKARRILGWNPGIDFKALVEMMVQADLDLLGQI
jgi:GDPmannose 4,6-dehydratase